MEYYFLLLLILLMACALGSGFPVAFALPGSAILTIALAAGTGLLVEGNADAYFLHGGPVQWLSAGIRNLRGVYWEPDRDTLIAIPLFIFMGIMLQRSRIAEDLLIAMAQLFGPVPGGLGISVVIVGALLAATTGIVGATVVAMGLISLPAMQARNYSMPLATGAIAASGTLGQIIPPSIVLIILADQLSGAVDQADSLRKTLFKDATGEMSMPSEFAVASTSAGDMFQGAILPGLVLVGLYVLYILGFALLRPKSAPPVPAKGALDRDFVKRLLFALVPPLTLIVLVLGSIIYGIATVNQAGAIGAAGALIMAGYRLTEGRRMTYVPLVLAIGSVVALVVILSIFDTNVQNMNSANDRLGVILAVISVGVLLTGIIWSAWRTYQIDDTLQGVMIETAKTTSFVFIILLGAAMLTAAFRAFGGEDVIRDFLNGMPGGFWTKFIIVMAVIFVLGFFLDFIEIAIVVVPIVAPILLSDPSANVSAVWLGVMIGLNMQTSFLTPPFGFALFYLRGVAPPSVKTTQIYKGVIPFILIQALALGVVGFYPGLVNYLPTRMSLASETAPPPRNPRLQYCIERYAIQKFSTDGESVKMAIRAMRNTNIDVLPAQYRNQFIAGLDHAQDSFQLIANVDLIAKQVIEADQNHRGLRNIVRGLQRDIRRLETRTTDLGKDLRDAKYEGIDPAEIEARIAGLTAEKAALLAQIPEDWETRDAQFSEVKSREKRARLMYRKSVDKAYQAVVNLQAVLNGAGSLASKSRNLTALESDLATLEEDLAEERVKTEITLFKAIPGTKSITSLLSDARREFRRKSTDFAKAIQAVQDANVILASEIEWRQRAHAEISDSIETYERAIRATIGIRSQSRLPKALSDQIIGCVSEHRDIAQNF